MGVDRLVREFRDKDVRIEIPVTSACGGVRQVSTTQQYRAEIARLPQMDRATEFRMARRHEFLLRRAEDALTRSGFSAEQIDELARRSFSDLPAIPDASEAAYLSTTLEDLARLRNLFVEGAVHLVLSTAYRYRSLGVDLVDLIQEGNASLFQAIHGFDWRRDVRFRTYAQFWVHQAVLKALYNSARTVRIPVWVQKALRKAQRMQEESASPMTREEVAARLDMPVERLEELTRLRRGSVSLDAPMSGGEETMSQQLPDHRPRVELDDGIDVGERLAEVMADLPARERSILNRRFGLEGTEPETLCEIAADLGISAERVRQLQNAAVQRLQKPQTMRRLADLV